MMRASTPLTAASIQGFRVTPMSRPLPLHCSRSFRLPRCSVKVQRTGLQFQFVFFRKHLQHPVCTQFPKLKFIRQFPEEVTMKLEEMQRK